MKELPPFDTPSTVEHFEGEVVLHGPGAMAGSFTPDAAEATGLALIDAAKKARDLGRWPKKLIPRE